MCVAHVHTSMLPLVLLAVKPVVHAILACRIDLGSAPPIISNVRIFEDEHELTPDVMLDMELAWHTEAMHAEVLLQLVSTHLKFLPSTVAKALSGLMTFRVRTVVDHGHMLWSNLGGQRHGQHHGQHHGQLHRVCTPLPDSFLPTAHAINESHRAASTTFG